MSKIRILYVSAEAAPYACAGGLGEVADAYPRALPEDKVDIRRVLPFHKGIISDVRYQKDFVIQMGDDNQSCIIKSDPKEKQRKVLFVDNAHYFNRDKIYGYYDDGERFLFFCKAVVEIIRGLRYRPHVVHLNDWHTGIAALLIKKEFPEIKIIFTIHNLSYQGWIPYSYLSEVNMVEGELMDLGYPGNLNFMRSGIRFADTVTTVSNGYAEEIMTPGKGEGIDDIIGRIGGITGILNGIDTTKYNPAKDGVLEFPYDVKDLSGKKKNREMFKAREGLSQDNLPIVTMISRLEEQKGIDLIIKALPRFDFDRFQLVIMGTGNEYYEQILKEESKKHPGKVIVYLKYDPDLARNIYGAGDIYLMPSRYEPGGVGHLYAMRYGNVPVVRRTGGLKDTVKDFDEGIERCTGFSFDDYSVEGLISALDKAVDTYNTPEWQMIIKNVMKAKYQWKDSVEKYMSLYS